MIYVNFLNKIPPSIKSELRHPYVFTHISIKGGTQIAPTPVPQDDNPIAIGRFLSK